MMESYVWWIYSPENTTATTKLPEITWHLSPCQKSILTLVYLIVIALICIYKNDTLQCHQITYYMKGKTNSSNQCQLLAGKWSRRPKPDWMFMIWLLWLEFEDTCLKLTGDSNSFYRCQLKYDNVKLKCDIVKAPIKMISLWLIQGIISLYKSCGLQENPICSSNTLTNPGHIPMPEVENFYTSSQEVLHSN